MFDPVSGYEHLNWRCSDMVIVLNLASGQAGVSYYYELFILLPVLEVNFVYQPY
jgi:hypothetical protein